MTSAPEASVEVVELRERQPSDLPALLAMLTAVHAETGYPVDGPSCFDEFLNPPPGQVLHTIVAVLRRRRGPADTDTDTKTLNGDVDQPIVGHAMLMSPTAGGGSNNTNGTENLNLASRTHLEGGGTLEDHAVLSRFFVSRGAQARGIGAKMLEAAVAWGRREGNRIVLVVLEKDAAAVRLYDRAAGWVRVGERDVFTSRWGVGYGALAYLGPDPRALAS